MAIPFATWDAAQSALNAVRPSNGTDATEQARLASELSLAVRVYLASTFVHNDWTPYERYDYLNSPITTITAARSVLELFRVPLIKHFADASIHKGPPPRLALLGGTHAGIDPAAWSAEQQADVRNLANSMKAGLNAHIAAPGVHFRNTPAEQVTAPEATNDASLIVLADDLRRVGSHLYNGSHLDRQTGKATPVAPIDPVAEATLQSAIDDANAFVAAFNP